VDGGTVWTLGVLGLACVAALALMARPLLFATLQPDLAEARGVPVRLVSVLFMAVVAVAVAEAAQIVGVLLVFTLMVGPAAAAQRLSTHLWRGIVLTVAIGLAETWIGITLAYHTDWPSSFWIAVLSGVMYFASLGWARLRL
jgi:zinc/manganese transport system permease protein